MYYVAIREVPVTAIFIKDNTGPEPMVQKFRCLFDNFLLGACNEMLWL